MGKTKSIIRGFHPMSKVESDAVGFNHDFLGSTNKEITEAASIYFWVKKPKLRMFLLFGFALATLPLLYTLLLNLGSLVITREFWTSDYSFQQLVSGFVSDLKVHPAWLVAPLAGMGLISVFCLLSSMYETANKGFVQATMYTSQQKTGSPYALFAIYNRALRVYNTEAVLGWVVIQIILAGIALMLSTLVIGGIMLVFDLRSWLSGCIYLTLVLYTLFSLVHVEVSYDEAKQQNKKIESTLTRLEKFKESLNKSLIERNTDLSAHSMPDSYLSSVHTRRVDQELRNILRDDFDKIEESEPGEDVTQNTSTESSQIERAQTPYVFINLDSFVISANQVDTEDIAEYSTQLANERIEYPELPFKVEWNRITSMFVDKVYTDNVTHPLADVRIAIAKDATPDLSRLERNVPHTRGTVKVAFELSVYDVSRIKEAFENRGIPVYGKGKLDLKKEEELWQK